ncbi:MAG TPA: hypothetical protein VE596_10035 [Gaiellaceae bacterium]|jgi:hypothetical protein|nr:hypothetical protein [Gaiellaceae bacterium]
MTTPKDREAESRESDETKFDEAVEHESDEREKRGERLADEPLSKED